VKVQNLDQENLKMTGSLKNLIACAKRDENPGTRGNRDSLSVVDK
jgi:hypothetical protein